MIYISVDGDDVGRAITSLYLSNNSDGLRRLSISLQASTELVSKKLQQYNFEVIFCAADGVVAFKKESKVDFEQVFSEIQALAPKNITFSAGIGGSLRESYIALTSAKCNGKNRLQHYTELDSNSRETNYV